MKQIGVNHISYKFTPPTTVLTGSTGVAEVPYGWISTSANARVGQATNTPTYASEMKLMGL